MARLSLSHHALQAHYPIVVIGSGYGGAIIASRLARAAQTVCLLEQGKEFQVGDYPDTELEALCNLQMDGLNGFRGSRTGLYHIYFDKEMSAFVGCGLGGTSLVNANVALEAEPRVFEDPVWPEMLRKDGSTLIKDGYQHARTMLKPTPYPESFPDLTKLEALEKAAKTLNQTFYRPPIVVNFAEAGMNHVGVWQNPCKLCGDCVSGCNYAAKNTLIMNYLPDANNYGAKIFTEIAVNYLEKQGQRWIIYYEDLTVTKDKNAPLLRFITADVVIVAGGTLGSTEILLRSKAHGLPCSDRVGQRFSGNGDVLAFGYNLKEPTYGIGYGALAPEGREPIGPCITGIIDMRNQSNLNEGFVIEEGSMPGGMAGFLPNVFALSARFVGIPSEQFDNFRANQQELESLVMGAHYGALQYTLTFLVMSHDESDGELSLEQDQLRINWPQVGGRKIFTHINEVLATATHSLGGTFIPNPVWSSVTEHTLITVHPLGGCVMGEDAKDAVVNHKGQVFSAHLGPDVYENLYVCDGSIIPRSLGVNPLLTISALAERCAMLMTQDRGWKIDYTLPSKQSVLTQAQTVGLEFTETMRGKLSTKILDNYDQAYTSSEASPFEFTLTIYTADLQTMLTEPNHAANITGTVTIPALSKKSMTAHGRFQLFVDDVKQINTRKMIYSLMLTSVEDKHYQFEGFKLIKQDKGLDVWEDTTTLYVTITDKDSREISAKGILKILPTDFMHQLTTMKITNTSDLTKILTAKVRFGNFFAGTLFQIYGGVFAKPTFFNPQTLPREKRKLRTNPPEVYFFNTADQQQLRLTRYQGGVKGPVILSHGLGVSSQIFNIDTIDTNLVEYLYVQGYDIWLLDYRASIDLPAANTIFSGDEIALYDYPAAINKVREITQAKDVQLVAHCFGATTLCMAMLAGLKGVRSIFLSQIASHMKVLEASRLKAGLYMPSVLRKLGVTSLSAYADENQSWYQTLFDDSLKLSNLSADEPCQSTVCRRITFLYGQLYNHAQLNKATHDVLHEMFGRANIKSFEHLALMVRKGHIVNSEGEESYLPHLTRLALPITIIHGAENHCFLPESTEITLDLLKEKNGGDFYTRHVIPGYGHIDCIFGQNAYQDVYPLILQHLEKTAHSKKAVTVS